MTDTSEDPGPREILEIRQRILAWGLENYRAFPWRTPPSPFLGLIAEILLQRTRAKNVVPVYEKFAAQYPTAEALARATPSAVEEMIRPLGLLWRAPLIHALGTQLTDSDIPGDIDGLLQLPGVGPYVAAAFHSFHRGGRGVLIDSNVVRWLARLTGRPYDAETRRKRWVLELADKITPAENVREFNFALLDFTMTICAPRIPYCKDCPLGPDLCDYRRTTDLLPPLR